jgi:hypothetical protein
MLYPDKKPSFQDIFITYCDINEIEITSDRQALIDVIVSQKYTSLVTFHKWGFLRYYFDQLIKEEISFEQFMTMGDIEGQIEDQINPHIYQEEHPVLLESLTPDMVSSWKNTTLVIVDPLIKAYYTHQHGEIITQAHVVALENKITE